MTKWNISPQTSWLRGVISVGQDVEGRHKVKSQQSLFYYPLALETVWCPDAQRYLVTSWQERLKNLNFDLVASDVGEFSDVSWHDINSQNIILTSRRKKQPRNVMPLKSMEFNIQPCGIWNI